MATCNDYITDLNSVVNMFGVTMVLADIAEIVRQKSNGTNDETVKTRMCQEADAIERVADQIDNGDF